MRIVIISLSFLLYVAAFFIVVSALSIPVGQKNTSGENREAVQPQSVTDLEASLSRLAEEQAVNREVVTELREVMARLEADLVEKKKQTESIKKSDSHPLTKPASDQGIEPDTIVKESNQIPAESGDETKVSTLGQEGTMLGVFSFPPGQVKLSAAQQEAIKDVLPEILLNPESVVRVEGHADSMPIVADKEEEFQSNIYLSLLRAKAVARFLFASGVSEQRTSIVGLGDIYPLASNETEEGRAMNRRVEIKLFPVKKQD